MALTINLSPREEQQLAAAAELQGVGPAEFVRDLVTARLPATDQDTERDQTLALFELWESEDEKMTPEEVEQERDLWDRFEKGINESRAVLGMRQL